MLTSIRSVHTGNAAVHIHVSKDKSWDFERSSAYPWDSHRVRRYGARIFHLFGIRRCAHSTPPICSLGLGLIHIDVQELGRWRLLLTSIVDTHQRLSGQKTHDKVHSRSSLTNISAFIHTKQHHLCWPHTDLRRHIHSDPDFDPDFHFTLK